VERGEEWFMQDESTIITQAQAGSPAAWTELYRQHYTAVYRFIAYQVREQTVAEDLATEVFLRALEHIGSYTHQGAPFLAWLLRIARNIVIDHSRRQKLRVYEPLDEASTSTGDGLTDMADAALTRVDIHRALAQLTDEQRQVLLMRFVHGMTAVDTGRVLGKSETAIKALQRRGLAALVRLLREEG